jgi:Mlc titration factor MtfA (ptsG expression regulator)
MAQLPAGHVPLIERMWGWLRRTPRAIDPVLWQQSCQRGPWLRGLDAQRRDRLADLSARFLHEKTISPVGGLVLDDSDAVLLAALCCLPLLELGEVGLRGWSQLIVYPDAFRVQRSHVDAAGVLHQWDDELIGESWDSGPLILSWADIQADIADPHAGYCVAVHEMAHKIDALDGAIDGTPPLPRDWQREWAKDFQTAYDTFCAQVDRGRDTLIDPYAAEAPEDIAKVLQRGVRGDERVQGHGIGLSIVQDLIKDYRGELQVKRSPELGGARFEVKLPPGP